MGIQTMKWTEEGWREWKEPKNEDDMKKNRVSIEFDSRLTIKHISDKLKEASKIFDDILCIGNAENISGNMRINDILIKIEKLSGGK
jgi:hypothetical protein